MYLPEGGESRKCGAPVLSANEDLSQTFRNCVIRPNEPRPWTVRGKEWRGREIPANFPPLIPSSIKTTRSRIKRWDYRRRAGKISGWSIKRCPYHRGGIPPFLEFAFHCASLRTECVQLLRERNR